MNYEERDPYGMYKVNPIGASGSRRIGHEYGNLRRNQVNGRSKT